MGKINHGRVFLGGLLAGVVFNIGEFILNEPILGEQWIAAMQDLNRPPIGGSQIAWFVIMGFAYGIAAVRLYAAIRPRFGPGPRTAIRAGLALWFLIWVLGFGSTLITNLYPKGLVLTSILWGLFEAPIATLVGAWVYREGA
jgi:hypothetical protein